EGPANDRPSTVVRMVAPGYFRTLRIPVLSGREFTDADNANPMVGFIVSETFARRYLSGRDPLATSISVWMQAENPYLPIIGVGGLLLAALGLYGLLAYLVAERTKDIGIRIALGARPARITGSVVGGGLALVAIGAAIGIAGSLLLLRSLGTLLFGVTPYDVPTYAIVVALLGAIAALASYLPARRAARIEPLTALRQE